MEWLREDCKAGDKAIACRGCIRALPRLGSKRQFIPMIIVTSFNYSAEVS
jgi:hypothetical protein